MDLNLVFVICATLFCSDIGGTTKVRYYKAKSIKRSYKSSLVDVFGFLGRFEAAEWYLPEEKADSNFVEYDVDVGVTPPYTTPSPPPTTTTTTTTRRTTQAPRSRQLSDYCLSQRGQFPYDPDCHSFVDCWDGSSVIKKCHPNYLVFDSRSQQCLFANDRAVKGRCQTQTIRDDHGVQHQEGAISQGTRCTDISNEGYECVPRQSCPDQSSTSKLLSKSTFNGRALNIGGASCPNINDICCRKQTTQVFQGKQSAAVSISGSGLMSTLCPSDFSGVVANPFDCNKFVNCWKGKPTIQPCAPGTKFNSKLGQCDFPHKANCREKIKPMQNKKDSTMGSTEFFDLSHLARSSIEQPISVPAPPSGQKIRLRDGGAPYTGYLELLQGEDKWGLVCDSTSWTLSEADLVCKQLGFNRGIKSTTQGLVHGPVNGERKLTESIECRGSEDRLEKCQIRFTSPSSDLCDLNKDIVSVTCIHDSLAVCNKGEVPWGNSCYSLHFNLTSFFDAQAVCKSENKVLVEITSQQENDLVSELLLASRLSPGLLKQIWTGGVAGLRARKPTYYWDGTSQKMEGYLNWWPGWNGERRGPPLENRDADMGIKMSRAFEQRTQNSKKVERLIDYYFWMLEDFRSKLPFICESRQKEIGCVAGTGNNYRGRANRGESGDNCLPWNSPQLSFILDEEKIKNLGDLRNNNYCRNPDGDSAPWCIAPNGEFDYCDIPKCNITTFSTISVTTKPDLGLTKTRCDPGQFQCGQGGECILGAYVCDGHEDCIGGVDEANCNARKLDDFTKTGRHRLDVTHMERWLHSSAEGCASHCTQAKNYVCRSFNYHAGKRLCTLADSNIGSSGKLVSDPQWDYYELSQETQTCDAALRCDNRKCLRSLEERCDGKNDCGDNSDEGKSCGDTQNMRIRLIGGRSENEGRIEVKAFTYGFGGICDDGFGPEEADVVCRQLGFTLGAKEVLGSSHFGHGTGEILIDELVCNGTENNLLQCTFNPWTETDCSDDEWVGVVCKTQEEECKEEEWRCRSGECISLEFLCDRQSECHDESDEDERLCKQPLKARLVDGNNHTAGRLEIRHHSVWGTICDDNFGELEGIVACRMLGFEGSAIVHSEAAYNPGQGPIWLHNVVCKGTEASLDECLNTGWGPTFRCKHLEDVGIECIPGKNGNKTRTNSDVEIRVAPTIECGLPKVEDESNIPVARVASGMQSKPGSQPWAAAVRLQGSQKSFHWCGAVLVSEFHVLTAAHCMEDYPKDVYRIRIGDWDMQVNDLEEQEFKVEAVYFHENYNVGLYLNNDIAVVKLQPGTNGRGIQFGERVIPACLPGANVVYGPHLNCTISGWGSTGISQPGYTRYLQSAKVPYLDTEKCMAPQVYGPKKLSGGMFCAGFLEGGVDTCQGDSGGGLVCDIRGRKSILGLTSWGYGCGRPNRPGVYTKVSNYVDWIGEKLIL